MRSRSSSLVFSLFYLSAVALKNSPAHAQEITRGPYLQSGAPQSVCLRWRTDVPTESVVEYGRDLRLFSNNVTKRSTTTEHELVLSDLAPHTKYFYRIRSGEKILVGGDDEHFFITSPADGDEPFKVWVVGDSGTNGYFESGEDPDQAAVRDAFAARYPQGSVPLFVMLGDNAYFAGSDEEYQQAVFTMYRRMMRSAVTWPTQGNHDLTDNAYYSVFTLPTRGESGGLASGTEHYYSFDYGNTHFISLNSEVTRASLRRAMLLWLREDIRAHQKDWTVVFWHHPPYSKGSHDSDDPLDSEGRMQWMRMEVLPILDAAGVDLVLSGHSHSYERSRMIEGHYGPSSTYSDRFVKGEGKEVFHKSKVGAAPQSGAVYVVSGNSGKVSEGPLNHPAMVVSLKRLGSMVLEVNGNQLSAQMIGAKGEVEDQFRMIKDPKRPGQVSGLSLRVEKPGRLVHLSWKGVPEAGAYKVYRSSVPYRRDTEVGSVTQGVTQFMDTPPKDEGRYFYSIRAQNLAGSGPWSEPMEVCIDTCS